MNLNFKALKGTSVGMSFIPRSNYVSNRNNKAEINKQSKRSPVLFTILEKIGQKVGETELILYEKKYNGKKKNEIGRTEGVFLDDRMKIINKPNEFMDNFSFNKILTKYYLTTGAMIFLLDRGGSPKEFKGKVVNVFPINPTWITKKPNTNENFYQINLNGEGIIEVHKNNIIIKSNNDIEKPYTEFYGIMQSFSDEISILESSSTQIVSYFQNNMTPDSAVSFEGMPETQAKLVEEKWKEKFLGVLKRKIPLFTGGKISYIKFQSEFKDAEVKDLRKEEREDIERKFNIVFKLDQANRNTAVVVKQEFYENQVIPILKIIKKTWNNEILPEIEKGLWLDYVDPTPLDKELMLQLFEKMPHLATKGLISKTFGFELEEWEDETEICIPSSMVRISLKTNKVITENIEEPLKVSEKKRLFGLNFKSN